MQLWRLPWLNMKQENEIVRQEKDVLGTWLKWAVAAIAVVRLSDFFRSLDK
jgi:hypothetical protein